MSFQKRISAVGFISLLLLFASIAFFRKKELKKKTVVTRGYIYEVGNSRYSGNTIFLKFKFSVDNSFYYGNTGFPCPRIKKDFFQSWTNGKEVEVVYEKNNPDNCEMLLTKESYNQYALAIPDEYKVQTNLLDSLCN